MVQIPRARKIFELIVKPVNMANDHIRFTATLEMGT